MRSVEPQGTYSSEKLFFFFFAKILILFLDNIKNRTLSSTFCWGSVAFVSKQKQKKNKKKKTKKLRKTVKSPSKPSLL